MKHRHQACFVSTAIAVMLSTVATTAAAQDVETITHGKRVDLESHLVGGKLTLFDFYADWCGPCRALAPELDRLAAAYPDHFAIRKVDIIDWDSEVTAQYRIQAIPHLRLYDEAGNLLGDGEAGRVMAVLMQRLRALGPGADDSSSSPGSGVTPIIIIGGLAAVTVFFLLRGRSAPRPQQPTAGATGERSPDTGSAGWFVMIQNSLEGPFTEEDLEDMVRRRVITASARTRRRGEAAWQAVETVIAHLT